MKKSFKDKKYLLLGIITSVYILLPILTFGAVNKLYFGYWFSPVPKLKSLNEIKEVESVASVGQNEKTGESLQYRFYEDGDFRKTIKADLNFYKESPMDSPAVLLGLLENKKLNPTEKAVVSEEDLEILSNLFLTKSPKLAKAPVYGKDVFNTIGEVFKLKNNTGETIYARDLRKQSENDHFLDEIVLVKDGQIVESHHFYFDVAGLEGLGLLAGFLVLIVETGILLILAGFIVLRMSKKSQLKIVGIGLIIIGIGILLYILSSFQSRISFSSAITKPVLNSTSDATANYKTYKNEKYGYLVELPRDMQDGCTKNCLEEEKSFYIPLNKISDNTDLIELGITVVNNNTKSFSADAKLGFSTEEMFRKTRAEKVGRNSHIDSKGVVVKYRKLANVTVDGQDAIQFFSRANPDYSGVTTWVRKNNSNYYIDGLQKDRTSKLEANKTYSKILSTFKFTESMSVIENTGHFDNPRIKFDYDPFKYEISYKELSDVSVWKDEKTGLWPEDIKLNRKDGKYSLYIRLDMKGIGGACLDFPKGYEIQSSLLDGRQMYKAKNIDKANSNTWPIGKIYLVDKYDGVNWSCPNVAGLHSEKNGSSWIEYDLSKLKLDSVEYKNAEKELDSIVSTIKGFWN